MERNKNEYMAQVVINGITFGSVRAKSTGTGIGDILVQSNVNGRKVSAYVQSEDFYKLVNAIDIDWNGAVVDGDTVINDTADLLSWIQSKSGQQIELATDDDVEALFEDSGSSSPGTGDDGGDDNDGFATDADIEALFR